MTDDVLLGMNESITQSKESHFSTEDVVPIFFRFKESLSVLEKPIKIKLRKIGNSFILGNSLYGVLGEQPLGAVNVPGVFDNSYFNQSIFDGQVEVELMSVIPVNNLYMDDLGEFSFVDFANTTATVTAHKIEGNAGDEYVSDWIVYNSPKTYTQAKFDFSNLDHNLSFNYSDSATFPLTFPLDFAASNDDLLVSTDGINWNPIDDSLIYYGNFNKFKFKIRFVSDGKYISFVDPNTKSLKSINIIFS